MIRIILTICLILLSFASAFAQETHTVTVEFSGMKSDTGALFVAVYNNKKSFLKKRYKESVITITDKKAIATFELLEGEFAISAFHDVNDNKKMDTRIFGIPKEPIGTSNNAKGMFGPPKFKDAKFKVDKNISMKITIAPVF